MPVAMERALKREAARRGYTGRRAAAFVYGTMVNRGYKFNHKKKRKRKKK